MNINELIIAYLTHLKVLGRSPFTLTRIKSALKKLNTFLVSENIFGVEELTPDILEEYQQELVFSLTAKGKPLSRSAQAKLVSAVKGFCRFLKEKDYLVRDPGAGIKLPKHGRRLPKEILSSGEIKKILNAADTQTNRGFRNRVILEILYDTGIRRSELSGIRVNDLDLKTGYVLVRGKGDKERVVPMSNRVCNLVESYIQLVRPAFLSGKDDGYLILNRWGKRMSHTGIYGAVRRCALLSGIKKKISPHTFRHTCATHMLKNGAPVRHVQEMLGHESLESTQVYTRVTINDLKKIHTKYHPGEQIEK